MEQIIQHKEILAEIRVEWDKAENSIKIAEQIGGKVVFPAVKELRYAGRRIIDALALCSVDGKSDKIKPLLEDALFDCYRAKHDAVDVVISIIASELNVATKRIGYRAILAAYPELSKFVEVLNAAQEKIASSRGMRDERDALYTALEQIELKQLVSRYTSFKASEAFMKTIAKQDRRYPLIGWLVGAAGIVVALIALYTRK